MFVLESLWRDGLTPNEKYTRKGTQYYQTLEELCEEEDKITAELSEEGKKHFSAYREAQSQLSSISEQEVFIEAVRLGARLILDIIGEYRGTFWRMGEG